MAFRYHRIGHHVTAWQLILEVQCPAESGMTMHIVSDIERRCCIGHSLNLE